MEEKDYLEILKEYLNDEQFKTMKELYNEETLSEPQKTVEEEKIKKIDEAKKEEYVNAAKEKSIGKHATSKKSVHKLSEKAIRNIKAFIAASVLILGFIAGTLIEKNIEYQKNLRSATAIVLNMSEDELVNNGLGIYDYTGIYVSKDNDIEDYEKLNLKTASPAEIYAYYLTCPTEEEFKELVQSATYIDKLTGEERNYTSLKDFYTVNGFIDEKTKEPSKDVFIEKMENELVNKLKSGEIRSIVTNSNSSKGRSA